MDTELERRMQACQMYYYQKLSKAEICRRLNCSRPWLDRWLNRYDPDWVEQSLSNRKAGPKQTCSPWSDDIRRQVLEMRRLRTQRDKFPYSLIGAAAIHYELEALKSREVPPTRTIHNWLVNADLVDTEPAKPEKREAKPIPLPQANTVNAVQQLDLKGPVYLRGSSHKYYQPRGPRYHRFSGQKLALAGLARLFADGQCPGISGLQPLSTLFWPGGASCCRFRR
jgi:transposase